MAVKMQGDVKAVSHVREVLVQFCRMFGREERGKMLLPVHLALDLSIPSGMEIHAEMVTEVLSNMGKEGRRAFKRWMEQCLSAGSSDAFPFPSREIPLPHTMARNPNAERRSLSSL